MKKNSKILSITAVIIVLPIIAFALSYGLNEVAPLSSNVDIYTAFFMLLLIAIGIGVPYAMLKLMSQASHIAHPEEKVIEIKDIPKDKDQMDKVAAH